MFVLRFVEFVTQDTSTSIRQQRRRIANSFSRVAGQRFKISGQQSWKLSFLSCWPEPKTEF